MKLINHSEDPVFIKKREDARTMFDSMTAAGELKHDSVLSSQLPLSHFLDRETAGTIMHVLNDIAGLPITPPDAYAFIATTSVMLEAHLVEWMRANPAAVEAIMRGAKK